MAEMSKFEGWSVSALLEYLTTMMSILDCDSVLK